MGLSKLSEKCKACEDKDKCDNKRMEACAYIVPNTVTVSNAQPILRNEIKVSIGNAYVNTQDIAEAIQNQIYKRLTICESFQR